MKNLYDEIQQKLIEKRIEQLVKVIYKGGKNGLKAHQEIVKLILEEHEKNEEF